MAKILDQAGLITLWAQIKGYAINADALTEALKDYKTSTELVEILSDYVTDEKFQEAVDEIKEDVTAGVTKVFTFKGNIDNYADLPTEDVAVGDVYNIVNADADNDVNPGDNVVWTGDSWDKLAGTIDLSSYAVKADVNEALANKTTQSIKSDKGESLVWNEASGGGAKFNHTDGTESFVGVNDGGAEGMVAQIYADKEVDGNWVGSRLNVYQKGMFYHNAEDKAAADYVADDPNHEVAVKKDIPVALTEEEIKAICQ
jgi:hypothetical protein